MCEFTYTRCGDYFIPNVTVPEESGTINKYGRIRRQYLKEHLPLLYQNMLLSGTLHKHLVEISEQAEERLETMMPLLMDTGLFVAMLDEEAQDDLRANKNLNVYKDVLYENMVAEAFVKSGYSLFYYKKDDSTLEEDFFVRTADQLLPVEVKATRGTAKTLRTLISSGSYPDIQCGIKLTGGNVGYSDNIMTFQYFCAFLLREFLKRGKYSLPSKE